MQVRDFMDFDQPIKVAEVYNKVSVNYKTGCISSTIYETHEECKAAFDRVCSDFYKPKLMEMYTCKKSLENIFDVRDKETGEMVYRIHYRKVAFKFTGIENKQ